MSIYKQANRLKLRFQTNRGLLTVEQLWDLTKSDLSTTIKAVKKVLQKNDDDELSFLEDTKTVDIENQLRFDILKDVYLTKNDESKTLREETDKKIYNEKIMSLIAEKQESELKSLSVDDLSKLLKK